MEIRVPYFSRVRQIVRRALLTGVLLAVSAGFVGAQSINRDDILYVMPYWFAFGGSSVADVQAKIADVRARLGEGTYVKVGFAVYIFIDMNDWNVNTSDPVAVRAALASTISQIDSTIAKARAAGTPVALSMLTKARETYDPAQQASEVEDIRNMQWYANHQLASGWWTPSRYARKQFGVQQAYWRELGKILANRMALYPDTVVAASGDGEVELAYDPRIACPTLPILADYSPFTIAEFRDWIRRAGMYADGPISAGQYAGQGYSLGGRYAGDATPGQDTNGDGHTLNGDFGTSFTSWNLAYADWSLSDAYLTADPHAIPLSSYTGAGWAPPAGVSGGFDAPRDPKAGPCSLPRTTSDVWWNLWVLFKQTLLQRHNTELAKWVTTSQDPETGATVPPGHWYSYQIPADYLFNGSPADPNERWFTSMSSHWTADVSPFGSLGITAFTIDLVNLGWQAYTLPNAAPAVAQRDVRWGVIEWNPGVVSPESLGYSTKPEVYRADLAMVEQYRPSLLQPFAWGQVGLYQVQDTGFEVALRDTIARLKDGMPSNPVLTVDSPAAGSTLPRSFVLGGWAVDLGKIRGPGRGPGIDLISVYSGSGPSRTLLGSASVGGTRNDVGTLYGSQFTKSGFSVSLADVPVGHYDLVVEARSTVTETFNSSVTIPIDVVYTGTATPASLAFAAVKAGALGNLVTVTAPQVLTPSYNGAPSAAIWSASANRAWLQVTNGPAPGQFTVGIINPNNVIGNGVNLTGTVTLSASNVGVTIAVPVTLSITGTGAGAAPFGFFDLPANGATGLEGSFPVTGWALDDIGIAKVVLYRDPVSGDPGGAIEADPTKPGYGKIYIADMLFVSGTRPDIEAAYPSYPYAYRAGWGYLMLSTGLPNQGNGTYTLYAYAYDGDGHITTLGSKTIGVDNNHATKPFGAIDYPTYGGTVSGNLYTSWGWALTPNHTPTCRINNGFVGMSIDSAPPIAVNYGDVRTDVAGLFLGLSNGSNAGGHVDFDTTLLANGMHTISWVVTDDCGRADGIGSRFFWVLNGAADAMVGSGAAAAKPDAMLPARKNAARGALSKGSSAESASPSNAPISVHQSNGEWLDVWPNATGTRVVDLATNGRVEILLPTPPGGMNYAGFHEMNGERRALPIGSSIDARAGIFYWQPGPGFLGNFDLVFVAEDPSGGQAGDVRMRVVVGPPMRTVVDTPEAESAVAQPFNVAGWTVDLGATDGTGIDTVHVWAYPSNGSAPIWLGVAAYGDIRPDVGRLLGAQFNRSSFGLAVAGLEPGFYNIVVYPHRARTNTFEGAISVRVRVR